MLLWGLRLRGKVYLYAAIRAIAMGGSILIMIVIFGIGIVGLVRGDDPARVPIVGAPAVGPSVGLTNEDIRRLGIVIPGPRGPTGCGWYDDDETGVSRLTPLPNNCNPKP